MFYPLKTRLALANIDISTPPKGEAWQQFLAILDTLDEGNIEQSTLVNVMPDALVVTDQEGTIKKILSAGVDPAIVQLLKTNYTLDELFNSEVEAGQRLIENVISTGKAQSGSIVSTELAVNLRITASQHSKFFVVLIKNSTKSIEAATKARLSNAIFNATDQGVAVLDASYNVLSINKALTKIIGHSEKDMIGRPPYFLDSVTSRKQSEQIWIALSNNKSWKGEFIARTRTDKQKSLWLSVDTVLDDQGGATNHLVLLSDISEEKKSLSQLQFIATHDATTGLPNRISFFEHMAKTLARYQVTGKKGAVLSLDIDRFKVINESLGHKLGDELLAIIAKRLGLIMRPQDFLACLGGDEFVLIAYDVSSRKNAAEIAQNALNVFAQPIPLGNYNIEITASIGITLFSNDDDEPGKLLRQADSAMYIAKEQDNNSFHFFSHELAAKKSAFFEIEMGLRQAESHDELFVHYQPQYDLSTGKMVGVEALARWVHPILGSVSPSEFIPVAEISGYINHLGDWVLEKSLADFSQWPKPSDRAFLLAVNLSRRQLLNPKLIVRMQELFERYNVRPDEIEFEITERAIVHINETATANIIAIRDMGCHLAMDDFGTGDSSLLNLKRFPFNRIKIDQSFVRDVTKDINDEAIIRAVIALANSLQMTVVAEGVELEAQAEFLRKEGCHQVQGYLYSKPISSEQCIKLIETQI